MALAIAGFPLSNREILFFGLAFGSVDKPEDIINHERTDN